MTAITQSLVKCLYKPADPDTGESYYVHRDWAAKKAGQNLGANRTAHVLRNCEVLSRNFRFGALPRASYASPTPDTTNLPTEQAQRDESDSDGSLLHLKNPQGHIPTSLLGVWEPVFGNAVYRAESGSTLDKCGSNGCAFYLEVRNDDCGGFHARE